MKNTGFITIVAIVCVVLCSGNIFGQSTESLMNDGTMLLSNGAYDQAVSKFRKVIARDPGNFEAQFNLAFSYLNWGRNSNAVTEFKRAVAINSRSTEAWSNLAMAYQNKGQDSKAINALYRAVELNPNNITARINLATMHGQRKNLSKAIYQYKQIIMIDGTNLDAHLNLSKCLISQNKHKEAKRYLQTATGIDPNDPEAYWELGNIAWNKNKNSADAIKNYEKAIALKENNQIYYNNLGLLYEHLNQKDKALSVWKKALVYLDDALQKEDIEQRIEMLEKGESPSGAATPEELFGKTDLKGADFDQLRNEMKKDDGSSTKHQTIKTEGFDIGSDLSDLSADDETPSPFSIDLKAAAKKKSKKNKE